VSRAHITLRDDADRALAVQWVRAFPTGTRIEFKRARRTLPQNSLYWSCLTDIARQLDWHGSKLKPDEWSDLFLDALKREYKTVRSLDGRGYTRLGRSSSDLSVDEMSDMLELIFQFGANHGVTFNDPVSGGLAPPSDTAPAEDR
jgi:hypothetical protein